jgi:hypothetical protein
MDTCYRLILHIIDRKVILAFWENRGVEGAFNVSGPV